MTTTLRLTCISVCLLALAGCETKAGNDGDGTETGDGDGDPTTGDGDGDGDGGANDHSEANFGDCGDETVTVLEDLAQIPPGFDVSVADMIATIEGQFAGTFTWAPADGGWVVSHAGTESPLNASITQVGEVRLVEVELNGQPPMGLEGSLCSNFLSVDVELGFATDDGVFAETFPTSMWIPGPTSEAIPGFYYPIDFDAIGGTLAAADFSANDGEVTAVILMGQLGDAGLTGELGMEVTIGAGPDGVVGFGLIADYTAAPVP